MERNLAIHYGGLTELADAVKMLVNEGVEIEEGAISSRLSRAMPDPDLLLRTWGQMHVSKFGLGQVACGELDVTETFSGDFTRAQLSRAGVDSQKRHRGLGGIGEASHQVDPGVLASALPAQ